MKLAPALAAILVLGTALSGCSSDGDSDNDAIAGSINSDGDDNQTDVVSPIFYDVSVLQGRTIEISLASPLIVHVTNPENWEEGGTSDEDVAQYEPGYVDGNASFNPAFYGVSSGTVDARMENSDTGETVTFTLVVNHEITGKYDSPADVTSDADSDTTSATSSSTSSDSE